MEIQSVLFDKNIYNTKTARQFLKYYKITPIKRVHITKSYLRYRISPPEKYKFLRIKKIKTGVKFIFGKV